MDLRKAMYFSMDGTTQVVLPKMSQWLKSASVLLTVLISMLSSAVSAEPSIPFKPQLLASNAQAPSLVFGVVPQRSASTLAKVWLPLLEEVSQIANVQLQFATAKDIPTFEARLAAGEYDIAYMNPYHYTVFSQSNGYRALVKEPNKQLKGILVVRKDSAYKTVADLQNKSLAFPAPAAFAASVITRAHLETNELVNEVRYVGSHDSVYLAVAKGVVDAGGGVMRTFNNVEESLRNQLTVLWVSPGYTPHAIALHPRAEQYREQILNAIVQLSTEESGRLLLEQLKFKGLAAAEDSDWDPIRALNLGKLNQASPQKSKEK